MTASILRGLALGLALVLTPVSLSWANGPGPPGLETPGSERQILVLLRMPPEHYRPNSDYGGNYGDGEGRSARRRIALRLAQEQGVSLVDEWPIPVLGVDCFVMTAPANQSPDDVAARLARDPRVSWSQPMHTYHGRGDPLTHNDPLYRVQPAAREWCLAQLHQVYTGRNVRVAVIDSMIDRTQPDLIGQVEMSENLVPDRSDAPEEHGTGVAGIIAARSDNGVGISGVAPQARLMGLRACWQEGGASGSQTICDSFSLAKALDFAISHNAQVINMSLSGPTDFLLSKLLDVALAHDVIVVGAYDRNLPGGGFPASHGGVAAVIDESTGPPITGVFSAPGHDVPTTEPGGRWFLVNGSSYAAAHVSGLFALLRQRGPLVHGASALVIERPGNTIDACATLFQKSEPPNCDCASLHKILTTSAK